MAACAAFPAKIQVSAAAIIAILLFMMTAVFKPHRRPSDNTFQLFCYGAVIGLYVWHLTPGSDDIISVACISGPSFSFAVYLYRAYFDKETRRARLWMRERMLETVPNEICYLQLSGMRARRNAEHELPNRVELDDIPDNNMAEIISFSNRHSGSGMAPSADAPGAEEVEMSRR